MMAHPGKKLLFMGQDFAQFSEWMRGEESGVGICCSIDEHKQLQSYVKALLKPLSMTSRRCIEEDYRSGGLRVDQLIYSADENMLVFMRSGAKREGRHC